MPLSNPWPGVERKVIALAWVAITERPIVPQPVNWAPFKYRFRLCRPRVTHMPYTAMPTIVGQLTPLDVRFGGTSLLIAVGVALDTMKQLEQQMVMRNYQGFLK